MRVLFHNWSNQIYQMTSNGAIMLNIVHYFYKSYINVKLRDKKGIINSCPNVLKNWGLPQIWELTLFIIFNSIILIGKDITIWHFSNWVKKCPGQESKQDLRLKLPTSAYWATWTENRQTQFNQTTFLAIESRLPWRQLKRIYSR